MKYVAPEGLVMTLSLPSFTGLILLFLAFIDPDIRYSENFHSSLMVLRYLGLITSLLALGLAISKRTSSSVTTKICFGLNITWLLYSFIILCIVWTFAPNW